MLKNRADATAYVWFLGQIYIIKSQTYTVAFARAAAGWVFMWRFRLFFGPVD